MSLRQKTLFIILPIFLILISIQYWIYETTLSPKFDQLEKNHAEDRLEKVNQFISNQIHEFDQQASKYFSTLESSSSRSDFLMEHSHLFDWALERSVKNQNETPQLFMGKTPISPELQSKIRQFFNQHENIPISKTSGLIYIDELWMIKTFHDPSSSPHLIFIAQKISKEKLDSFLQASSNIQFSNLEGELPDDFETAKKHLLGGEKKFIEFNKNGFVSIYTLLQGANGFPGSLLKLNSLSQIKNKGRQIEGFLILTFLVAELLTLLILMQLLDYLILQPISSLNDQVQSIGKEGHLRSRVEATRKDELGVLAKTFNETLIALDQSQKKRAEAEEIFQKIFQESPIGMLFTDLDGRIAETNLCFCQFTNWSPSDLIDQNFFSFLHPEETKYFQNLTQKTVEKSTPFHQAEIRLMKKNKNFIWTRCTSSVLANSQDHPTYIIHFIENIQTEKELEEMKEEFITTVSHELRTPLSIIKGAIGNLKDGVMGETSNKQQTAIAMAYRNTHRLERLIQDLLNFSRLELGEIAMNKQKTLISKLLEEIREDFDHSLEEEKILIEANEDVLTKIVSIDTDWMRRVFFNLIDNALKVTKKQSRVQCKLENENIHFCIEDDGPGISSEKLKLLFHKFQQIDRPIGGAGYKGMGLGLVMSQKIIELHEGKIWVESTPHQGTKVYFTLPISF